MVIWSKVLKAIAYIASAVSFIWILLSPPLLRVGFNAEFIAKEPEHYHCISSLSHISLHGAWSIKIENFSQSESIRFKDISVAPFSWQGGTAVMIDVDKNRPKWTETGPLITSFSDVTIPASEIREVRQDAVLPHISRLAQIFISQSNSCTKPMSWKNWFFQSSGKNLQPDTLTLNLTMPSGKSVALSAIPDAKKPNSWIIAPHVILNPPLLPPMVFNVSILNL